jgi:hypothetical protein
VRFGVVEPTYSTYGFRRAGTLPFWEEMIGDGHSGSPLFLRQRFRKERNCSVISITDGRRPSRSWKASRKAM